MKSLGLELGQKMADLADEVSSINALLHLPATLL